LATHCGDRDGVLGLLAGIYVRANGINDASTAAEDD
jgi:hypothetical protein